MVHKFQGASCINDVPADIRPKLANTKCEGKLDGLDLENKEQIVGALQEVVKCLDKICAA